MERTPRLIRLALAALPPPREPWLLVRGRFGGGAGEGSHGVGANGSQRRDQGCPSQEYVKDALGAAGDQRGGQGFSGQEAVKDAVGANGGQRKGHGCSRQEDIKDAVDGGRGFSGQEALKDALGANGGQRRGHGCSRQQDAKGAVEGQAGIRDPLMPIPGILGGRLGGGHNSHAAGVRGHYCRVQLGGGGATEDEDAAEGQRGGLKLI